MNHCPKCNTEWEPTSSPFRLCRACRRQMPVRRVNTEPLDMSYRLLRPHRYYPDALKGRLYIKPRGYDSRVLVKKRLQFGKNP